jgi:hypothetical protein
MNHVVPMIPKPSRIVTRERRRTPRVTGPFNATWSGGSGTGCLVPNLSVHGCYVNCLSAPPAGSPVTLRFVTDRGRTLHVHGEVRSVDPGIGFSVQFDEMPSDDFGALACWMGGRAAGEAPNLGDAGGPAFV